MKEQSPASLKLKTARTLKWNTIDRVSSQVLYAVTGIVLANILPQADFGLAGVILIFQAFAILFVDSGFGAALLQKKNPDNRDYSTVFWFNLIVSIAVYIILFFCAPLIADIFHHEKRLILLSRVMFLSFVISGLGIVQTNRLVKRMDVRQVAVANVIGLILSGGAGIWLALTGAGVWALVWQSIILAAVKTGYLWIVERWIPEAVFSMESLKNIYRVGAGVFTSSLFNTIFLNIYSFVIGATFSFARLGDYTQADKWSKMGSASVSQILTSTFIPVLAQYQDDSDAYHRLMHKINGFTAFLLYPAMLGLVVTATPVFHLLFGAKWDAAILLFQILLIRGIFTVLTSLCNNYLLALGHAKSIVKLEVVKDVIIAVAILATIFMHSVPALVWGQMGAGVVTYIYAITLCSRNTGFSVFSFVSDQTRYILLTLAAVLAAWPVSHIALHPSVLIIIQAAIIAGIYLGCLRILHDPYLQQGSEYLLGRFKHRAGPLKI